MLGTVKVCIYIFQFRSSIETDVIQQTFTQKTRLRIKWRTMLANRSLNVIDRCVFYMSSQSNRRLNLTFRLMTLVCYFFAKFAQSLRWMKRDTLRCESISEMYWQKYRFGHYNYLRKILSTEISNNSEKPQIVNINFKSRNCLRSWTFENCYK